jgi:hypothetical protein
VVIAALDRLTHAQPVHDGSQRALAGGRIDPLCGCPGIEPRACCRLVSSACSILAGAPVLRPLLPPLYRIEATTVWPPASRVRALNAAEALPVPASRIFDSMLCGF